MMSECDAKDDTSLIRGYCMFKITWKEAPVAEAKFEICAGGGMVFAVMPDVGIFDIDDYCDWTNLRRNDFNWQSVASAQDRASQLFGGDVAMLVDHEEE